MQSLSIQSMDVATYKSNVSLGDFTILATSKKTVKVVKSNKTYENKTFSKALSLGGVGKFKEYRCIEIKTNEKLTINCITEGEGTIALLDEKGNTITTINTDKALKGIELNKNVEGPVYFMITKGSPKIFSLEEVAQSTEQPIEENQESSLPTVNGFATFRDSGNYATQEVVVKTAEDFKYYAEKGGYVIKFSGTIDLSKGMLPSKGGDSTNALDNFVRSVTEEKYASYKAFKEAYAAQCKVDTNDNDRDDEKQPKASGMCKIRYALSDAYGKIIKIKIASNTTILGLEKAVLKGGSLWIGYEDFTARNIIIQNVTIQDAYDPFPWHGENDGYNADWDCINIFRGKNIFIDHCTFEDTLKCDFVKTNNSTSEEWQTYDGLCDIKRDSSVTVSYCKFYNHDKTMLIGNRDDENLGGTGDRYVTLHHNYFLNCGQRLPFVRKTNLHIYDCYFDYDSKATYKSQCAIQPRFGCKIVAENNFFSKGIKYSLKGNKATENQQNGVENTLVYLKNCTDNTKGYNNQQYFTIVNTVPFAIPYNYELEDVSKVISLAGPLS